MHDTHPPQNCSQAPNAMPLPGPPLLGGTSSHPGDPYAASNATQGLNAQATRHARRIYVGGVPPTGTEQSIATFFSHALAAIGGNTAGPGNSVVNVYINREKNFSFVEFRTVEETSNAMALDGIMFEGVQVRIRRPNDYNPNAARGLGPSGPNPNLNLAAIGLGVGGIMPSSGANQNDPNRIFIGGLPHYLTDPQCRELVSSFGPIKSFDLVVDRALGTNKGYGFVVYQDPAVTDIAIAGLNGLKMGERVLTVRRSGDKDGMGSSGDMLSSAAAMSAAAIAAAAAGGMGIAATHVAPIPGATRFVVLTDAVTVEEISVEDEYNDILEDMKEECGKHGDVELVIIPRSTPDNPNPVGLGKVIIAFKDVNSSVRARNAMHGRKFAGRVVSATWISEEQFTNGDF